jgi:hypothetical protein
MQGDSAVLWAVKENSENKWILRFMCALNSITRGKYSLHDGSKGHLMLDRNPKAKGAPDLET